MMTLDMSKVAAVSSTSAKNFHYHKRANQTQNKNGGNITN
jgi:hypothetical protein